MDSDKIGTALGQWRDSLINLSSRNKLLNYKKTRASTIEFGELTATEIYDRLLSRSMTYIVGTKNEPPKKEDDDEVQELEELVANQVQDFDYSKYKDSLFTALTQREVDKKLKTISSAARREFLDKGISPLYLALGALSWKDEAEDTRTSPLVMVPVELNSIGPKEPLYLSRSDEDIAVNPALALKLSEFGITLPTSEEIIDALESGGLDQALSLFRRLPMKSDWQINDFATLAVFAFQKEAMYRDLLDNEELVLGNPIIQALGGGTTPEQSDFYFDPIEQDEIDEIAPPETTALVLDADSSQRAAVAAAASGYSFVLDGPPGTGKSQTIANIIGELINRGKSVLFVSEKIVALEVVRDRLDQRGLGAFLFELHSHKATRKEVAKQLGKALKQKPVPPNGMPSIELGRAEELRRQLNDYAAAMNEVREPLQVSVHQVLGLLEQLALDQATPTPDLDISNLDPSGLEKVRDACERLEKHWDLYLAGSDAEWFGLEDKNELAFRIDDAITALSKLEKNYEPIHSVAVELRMDGTLDGENLYQILEYWASGQEFHDEKWLTSKDLVIQRLAIKDLQQLDKEFSQLEETCAGCLGANWKDFSFETEPRAEDSFAKLNELVEDWTSLPAKSIKNYLKDLDELVSLLTNEINQISALSDQWGITTVDTFDELNAYQKALRILESSSAPPLDWIASKSNRKKAEEALHILMPLVKGVQTAQQAAHLFTKSVVNLDLEEMSDFFAVNTGFFKSLSKPYREKKKTLRSFSKTRNWKETLEALPKAFIWKTDLSKLVSAEEHHAATLAPLYKSLETDWRLVSEALETSKVLLEGFEVTDQVKFANSLESSSVKEALLFRINGIGQLIHTWNEWSSFETTRLSESLNSKSLKASLFELQIVQQELDEISLSISPFEKSLPDGIEISYFLLGLGESWKHESLSKKLPTLLNLPSKSLNVEIRPEAFRNAGFLENLEAKLSWTAELRRHVNSGKGREDLDKPLSKAEFKVLQSAKLPQQFQESSEAWQKKWATLKSSFSPSAQDSLDKKVIEFRSAGLFLSGLRNSLHLVDAWFDLNTSLDLLDEFGLERALESATELNLHSDVARKFILKSLLSHWVSFHIENDERLGDDPTFNRSHFVDAYRELDIKLKDNAISNIISNGAARRPKSGQGQAGLIEREAEKKTRHIPVRELIDRSRDVIKGVHPCFMMSPLAVSQYLPADIQFDVVIFDEASQVTPADAINCAYRGQALITAGDQKQLPPMSFFATSGLEDESMEEDAAGDYDSVLDLMKASGSFNSMTLNWHYRSRHENLIAYSNFAFYDRRLITFPGAIADSDDLGVKFIKVDGVYRRSGGADNPIEAKEVARRVLNHFDKRPGQSLGVVTFSTSQRDAIEYAVSIARSERPDLEKYFEGSRQDGFFVNSLEAVQGDERDVIIFSVGYGPDESGKIYKNFGPLNRAGGERRLNVAITRARKLVEIVSSMTASELGDVNNEGARHLRKYLDFAERGPVALQMELGEAGLETDSPFEDSVISAIQSWGFEVQPQVGVAGYRIDIGVKHPNNPGAFILGVECDGAMYHSSRAARDRDRLRHEILEGLGWRIHHIWGTGWYRHREREMERLKAVIEEQVEKQISGRLVVEKSLQSNQSVEIAFEKNDALDIESWTEEYQIATLSAAPTNLDLSDIWSARHLVPFVKEVVEIESPIHKELLLRRIRDASNIGKAGAKIRATIDRAIGIAGIQVEKDFLWSSTSREVYVRRANPAENRDISLICAEELYSALEMIVDQATGITRNELVKSARLIFGWKRSGPKIESVILEKIDNLIDSGVFAETAGGLRVS